MEPLARLVMDTLHSTWPHGSSMGGLSAVLWSRLTWVQGCGREVRVRIEGCEVRVGVARLGLLGSRLGEGWGCEVRVARFSPGLGLGLRGNG